MKFPEDYRIMGEIGCNGAFIFNKVVPQIEYRIIASSGEGWEHVSVTLNRSRCPTWEEMCEIKGMFWNDDECVVQFHAPKSDYINNHPYCLHLWKPIGYNIKTPDTS